MTAVEHIVAWIESSSPHYDRLLQLERERKTLGHLWNVALAQRALYLVTDAYQDATRGGDMFPEDQSPQTLLDAARALLEWELEQ